MLLLSVAPDVKINSDGPASNTPASCSLACWTARLALVPQSWVRLPALPNSLVIQWRNTSATRGSTRVVADESRTALIHDVLIYHYVYTYVRGHPNSL